MNKEDIEKAIETINELIYDYCSTMDGLVEVKIFLNEILDEKIDGCVVSKDVARSLLKNIESDILSCENDPRQPSTEHLYKLHGALLGALGENDNGG